MIIYIKMQVKLVKDSPLAVALGDVAHSHAILDSAAMSGGSNW